MFCLVSYARVCQVMVANLSSNPLQPAWQAGSVNVVSVPCDSKPATSLPEYVC